MKARDLLAQPRQALTVWERLKLDTDARIRERNAQRRAAAQNKTGE